METPDDTLVMHLHWLMLL